MNFPESTYNIEAELAILANLMYVDEQAMKDAVSQLTSLDFFDRRHQAIFKAIRQLGNKSIDTIIVSNHLRETCKPNIVTSAYLLEIFEKRTGSVKSTVHHAEIVKRHSILRQMIVAGEKVKEIGLQYHENIDSAIEQCTVQIETLRTTIKPAQTKTWAFQDLINADLPEPEFILKPIWQTHYEILLHARAGVGKSHFVTEIAYAIASGGQVFKWTVPQPRSVLIIDGEMPIVSIANRYRQVQERNQLDTANRFNIMSFMDFEEPIDLLKVYWQAIVNRKIDELKVEVLILDNLDSLFNLDQNKQVDWIPAQRWLKRLRGNGLTTIIVHHSNKQGGVYGTSALSRQPNVVMALLRPDEYDQEQGAVFDVKFEKGRELHSDNAATFRCSLNHDGWTITESPKSVKGVKLAIVESIREGNTHYREIASDLGKSDANIKSYLTQLVKDKMIRTLGRGQYALTSNATNISNVTNISNTSNLVRSVGNKFETDSNFFNGVESSVARKVGKFEDIILSNDDIDNEVLRIIATGNYTPVQLATGLSLEINDIVESRYRLQRKGLIMPCKSTHFSTSIIHKKV